MNLSDLYAIGCLLLWGGLGGYAILLTCRKSSGDQIRTKFPVGTALLAALLSMFLDSILLIGNPGYLVQQLFSYGH